MNRPISTKAHGILDYATAGLLLVLPRAMGWSKAVTRLMDGAGMGAVGYSLLTRYELGVAKVLPMKAHLTLDALSGGMLVGAAVLMDDEEPEVRSTLAALGLFEIAAAVATEPRSPLERGQCGRRRPQIKGDDAPQMSNPGAEPAGTPVGTSAL